MALLDAVRVVAITDRRLMGDGPAAFGAAIARAVEGCPPGSVLIQLREKDLDGTALLALYELARAHAPTSINDRIDVALVAGAPGVHLPEHGLSVDHARALFGGFVGVSRHAPDASTSADLVQLGPIFTTPSKPGVPALGLELLGRATTATLVAVGGIDTPARAREAARAGADAVAVIRGAWASGSLAPLVAAVEAGRGERGRR